MKYRASIKIKCEHCQIVKREGKLKVICKRNPKHRQTQG